MLKMRPRVEIRGGFHNIPDWCRSWGSAKYRFQQAKLWILGSAATVWKRAKMSYRTLAGKELAASPWQCPVSHFRPHRALSGELLNGCHPPRTIPPNLAPCDFFLFPKIKLKLKERRLNTTKEIQAESQRVLDTLTENVFQEAFQKWRRRWYRCQWKGQNILVFDTHTQSGCR
jgi:hypothetical protein